MTLIIKYNALGPIASTNVKEEWSGYIRLTLLALDKCHRTLPYRPVPKLLHHHHHHHNLVFIIEQISLGKPSSRTFEKSLKCVLHFKLWKALFSKIRMGPLYKVHTKQAFSVSVVWLIESWNRWKIDETGKIGRYRCMSIWLRPSLNDFLMIS